MDNIIEEDQGSAGKVVYSFFNENSEELDMKVPHNNRLKYERDSSEGEPIVKKLDDLTIDSSSVVSIEDNLQDKNDGE